MLLKAARPILWSWAPQSGAPLAVVVAGECIFRFVIAGIEIGSVLAVLRMSDAGSAPAYFGIHFFLMGTRGFLGPVIGLALYRSGVSIPTMYRLVAAIVIVGGLALAALAVRDRQVDAAPRR
jgi:hypothetical protein